MPIPLRMLWKCTWPDGKSASFVLARTQHEAIDILSGLGYVDSSMLEVVDHQAHFFVTFRACYETQKHTHGESEYDIDQPHWHANDENSEDIWTLLGDPPPLEPVPEPEEPKCKKCGQGRFAPVHHPDYDKSDRCEKYEPPAELATTEPPAEVGPDRPTSE
jgi:hypothetical protein